MTPNDYQNVAMNAVAVILKILKFCQFWFRQIEDSFCFDLWQWSKPTL